MEASSLNVLAISEEGFIFQVVSTILWQCRFEALIQRLDNFPGAPVNISLVWNLVFGEHR